jgi:LysR family transcriptional activator of nhaA
MAHFNYNHLYYFWVVAKTGSIARAVETLFVTPQTVSGQLRTLEESLNTKLFRKQGRGLALTDSGAVLFQYADEMFRLGTEVENVFKGKAVHGPSVLRVGVSDAVPKLISYRLLEPALNMAESVRLVCREGFLDDLLGELAIHRLDLVIADRPLESQLNVRAYSHLLGESGMSFFAEPELARSLRRRFPQSLDGAPMLAPDSQTLLRRALDQWFAARQIQPRIVGEFQDSALIKAFGQAGHGFFVAPSAIEAEIRRQHRVTAIAAAEGLRERFYAISVERKLKHPAVLAISAAAHDAIFRP